MKYDWIKFEILFFPDVGRIQVGPDPETNPEGETRHSSGKKLTRFEKQIEFDSFTGMIKLFVEQKSNRWGALCKTIYLIENVIAKRGTEKVMEKNRVVRERQM